MTLSNESEKRITLLYRTAQRNGSLISVQELSRLLAEETSERELVDAVASTPTLSSIFELRSGYLTERRAGQSLDPTSAEMESRRMAQANFTHAASFAPLLRSGTFEMAAVSGSTSYGSASHSKDVDFFCVSRTGQMWVSLAKSLLLARTYRTFHRGAPEICFSYIMDEQFAHSTFESRRDPLFARDAVQTKVLKGREVYDSLLARAAWISDFFPVAYGDAAHATAKNQRGEPPSPLQRVLNRFLFHTLGSYLRLKSSLLNRLMSSEGRNSDLFDVRSAEDHLVYESRRYAALRRDYTSLGQRNGSEVR
jgi:hypothetical protein